MARICGFLVFLSRGEPGVAGSCKRVRLSLTGPVQPGERDKELRIVTGQLVVGAFSPSVVLRVSRRLGLLDERGLEVTENPVTSSPAQFRALIDGDLDAALTSPDNVIAYRF